MQRGLTLIEVLLYVALVSFVMAAFILFDVAMTNARIKAEVIEETHANARHALGILIQRVREATAINTGASVFGADPGVLSLAMTDSAKDPTVFDLDQDDGTLRITEGASAAESITSNAVKITNLVFKNLGASSLRGHIQVQMTIEYKTASARREYMHMESFKTSISLRK